MKTKRERINQQPRNQQHTKKTIAIVIGLILTSTTFAQEEVNTDEAALEEIIVTATGDYNSILPADSSSVFGLDKSLSETPRSITEVSAELIENFALRNVDDLVRLTPGAFTSSFFGIRGAMDIRGEPADNYYRGFKRIANPGAFNTIVRGAEKLEILRGPVSPLYGSGSVGGQLNYIPNSNASQRAISGGSYGDINITLGSHDQRIISGNFGSQIGESGGMHVFAEVEDSESFYELYEPSSELLQIAFNFDLSDATTLEFGGQYQSSDSIQVPGWTRVTQDLIDNGTYITGAAPNRNTGADPTQLLPSESGFISEFADVSINNSFSNVGTFCVNDIGFNNGVSYNGRALTCFGGNSTPWISPISNPGTATLDHSITFIDEIDFADSTAVTLFGEISTDYDNGMIWKTEFFYDYMDHTKFQSWGFTADYPDATTYELRSSLKFDLNSGYNINSTNIVGINYRVEDLELKHAFFDETFDFRDLTVGATPNDRIAAAVDNPLDGPDILRNFNQHEISNNKNIGLFFLSDIYFGNLNLLIGGRYDNFDVESEDVAVTLAGIRFDSVTDFEGKQSDSEGATSFNASLSYTWDSGVTAYATHAKSNSLSTNQLGGISPSTVPNGLFLQESTLSEVGVKIDGFDDRIYAAITYYDQEKVERTGQTQALTEVFGDGIEVELRAVVNDSLSLIATATNTNTTEIGDSIFTVVNASDFAEQNGLNVTDLYGGRIAGDRSTFVGEGAELERGGLPDNIVSLYGTYQFGFGETDLTASLGLTWVEETYIDVFKSIKLPSYNVWTSSMRYQKGPMTALLQVNNLFNEKYYTSADLFDSVVVKPSEDRTVSLSLTYEF